MRYTEDVTDENGILHMCKKCHFVLFAGDKKDRVLVSKFYNEPPKDVNFVVCHECS